MGDRANVLVRENDNDPGVYLYTHWSGSDLPFTLARALSRKAYWYDSQYLTRIIFCEMIKGDEDGETGFGISSFCGDGEDRVLIVDCETQCVKRDDYVWSFDEFIERGAIQLANEYGF